MAEQVYTDLSVCADCAMLIANGEDSDGVAERVAERWGDLAVHLVLSCSGCDDCGFSWASCDGCGSTLGGDRHAAAVIR